MCSFIWLISHFIFTNSLPFCWNYFFCRYGSKISNASLWNSSSHEANRSLIDQIRPGLIHGSPVSNNIRGSEYWTNNRSFQNIFSSSISNHLPKLRHDHQEWTKSVTFNSIQGHSRTFEKFEGVEDTTNQAYYNKTTGKRGASTSIDLDLDLSLKLVRPEKKILEETETAATTTDQTLSLSLCSGSSSCKKSRLIKTNEEDRTVKIGQTSTLDLTLWILVKNETNSKWDLEVLSRYFYIQCLCC